MTPNLIDRSVRTDRAIQGLICRPKAPCELFVEGQ